MRLLVGLAVVLLCSAAEPSARELAKRAKKFEKRGDIAQAYLLWAQAAASNPNKKEYWLHSQALRTRAIRESKVMPSEGSLLPDEPEIAADVATKEEVAEARKPQPPAELVASLERKPFNLRGDSKVLYEKVAREFGLEVIFDGDYQPSPPIVFRLDSADYRDALYALNTASSSFIVPISDKVFLVAKDTEQKRKDVEVTVAISIPLPEPVSVQEAQELARAVQQLMEIQRFGIDSSQRMVVIRDRISKVVPAIKLFQDLLHRRAQIVIEAQLINVANTSQLDFGLTLPTNFPITTVLRNLTLGGGGLGFMIGIASAEAIATASKGSGRALLRAELRTVDGMPATMKAGDKYPIMTSGYFGDTSGSTGQIYTPPPSFNFEDLGLTLKVTPKVHDSKDVTLDLEAEYKLLTGESFNGIPVISNKKFANRVRLRFDQSAVIAGLVSKSHSRTYSGFPLLDGVPFLGGLLGRTSKIVDDSQLLLILTPRLLDLPASEIVVKDMWIGSETRPLSPI